MIVGGRGIVQRGQSRQYGTDKYLSLFHDSTEAHNGSAKHSKLTKSKRQALSYPQGFFFLAQPHSLILPGPLCDLPVERFHPLYSTGHRYRCPLISLIPVMKLSPPVLSSLYPIFIGAFGSVVIR